MPKMVNSDQRYKFTILRNKVFLRIFYNILIIVKNVEFYIFVDYEKMK